MNDSNSHNLKPSDHELLAFVEGDLSPIERRTMEERLARSPETLRRLHALQRDRKALAALQDPEVPEWLAARISQLALSARWTPAEAETEAVEPPIPMPTVARLPRRHSALPRLAMAASILLALSASLMVTWWAASEVTDFAARLFDSPGHLPQGNGSSDSPALALDNATTATDTAENSDSTSTDPDLALAATAISEPGDDAALTDSPLVIEVGTAVRIASGDRLATLEHLAASLLGSGDEGLGGLIVNASTAPVGPTAPDRAGPAHAIAGLSGRVLDQNGQESPPSQAGSDARPAEVSLVISPLDQLRYSREGFAYTLVGRPSDILALLDELAVQPDHRLYWYSQQGLTRLRHLVRPSAPAGAELIAALHWFANPAANPRLTARLLASAREEPLVQVPLTVVEWDSLQPRSLPESP